MMRWHKAEEIITKRTRLQDAFCQAQGVTERRWGVQTQDLFSRSDDRISQKPQVRASVPSPQVPKLRSYRLSRATSQVCPYPKCRGMIEGDGFRWMNKKDKTGGEILCRAGMVRPTW